MPVLALVKTRLNFSKPNKTLINVIIMFYIRSNLEVELLDTKHINFDEDEELEFERPSSSRHESFLTVPQQTRRRRRRLRSTKKSFNFEMSYDDLQLHCLQFSVMCRDQSSRQKVIGDVILPMADLTSQGVDVTRELVMWRDVQTLEMQQEQQMQRVRMSKKIEFYHNCVTYTWNSHRCL